MTQKNSSLPEIAEVLNKIHLEKDTGTFSITTDSNRSAQLIIKDGVITFVYYFNKQGIDALELMMSIEKGRYRFQQGPVASKTNILPSTPDIIKMLSPGTLGETEQSSKSISSKEIIIDATDFIDNEKVNNLKQVLGKIVGPAGSFLIDDAMKSMGITPETIPVDRFDEVIETITSSIPGNKQQLMFKDKMTRY